MATIGTFKDPDYGRKFCDMLDAETQKKRQPMFRDVLKDFVDKNVITQQQADSTAEIIAGADAPPHGTPYMLAVKAGILNDEQLRVMERYIMEKTHSAEALCSGTASYIFDSGETVIESQELSTDKRDDNIIKATNGAVVKLKNCQLLKKGDTTDHSEGSFTGLNAGVLAEGGTIHIEDTTITADAYGGNNIFAHGPDSKIYLKNVVLDAYGKAANRCVYCSWGGYVEAENCEFTSRGVISSTVATDTGRGTIKLKNCLIKTLGSGCASLYSTGAIYADNCVCVAPETEGLIVIGRDYLELNDSYVFSGSGQGCKLAGSPGNPDEYCEFKMTGGSLSALEGAAVYSAGNGKITLQNVKIANPSGIAFAANFNGPNMDKMMMPGEHPTDCHVNVTIIDQYIEGDSIASPKHGMALNITQNSRYKGSVNTANDALYFTVSLDASSVWELTGDSYVDELVNADTSDSNIITNGFKLEIGTK